MDDDEALEMLLRTLDERRLRLREAIEAVSAARLRTQRACLAAAQALAGTEAARREGRGVRN